MTAPSTTGLDDRLAAVLCYSVWWITGALFLLLERKHRIVRFHAAQSLVLFGVVSVALAALGALSAVSLMLSGAVYELMQVSGKLLWLGATVVWLVLVLRAWRGEVWRVPLVAALADRVVERTSS